jgi:hypothetical protein
MNDAQKNAIASGLDDLIAEQLGANVNGYFLVVPDQSGDPTEAMFYVEGPRPTTGGPPVGTPRGAIGSVPWAGTRENPRQITILGGLVTIRVNTDGSVVAIVGSQTITIYSPSNDNQ